MLAHEKVDVLSEEDRAWRAEIQLRESQARKQKLLDTLSIHDYIAPLKRERKKRYGRTSLWLSKTDEYNEWIDGSTPFFWLSGILGSGKTICTAAVVDDLLGRRPPKSAHRPSSSVSMMMPIRCGREQSCNVFSDNA